MIDLISRQAVMDATKAVMKDVLDSLPTRLEDGEEIYDVKASELDFILNINKALQNAIKALPSETHDKHTETHGVCLDELISRAAAIDAIEMVDWYHQNQSKDMVSGANSDEHQAWYKAEDVYEAIEAVGCAEPKTGEWIEHEHGFWTFVNDKGERDGWIPDYECNLCGARAWRVKTPFCPTCGARMKGADDE